MLKKQVKVGSHYVVRHHDGKFHVVQIHSESIYGGYNALKLKTQRMIRIKSAAKLRYEVERNSEGKWAEVK